jgi:hypothetical protein
VLQAGGVFTASHVVLVLVRALAPATRPAGSGASVSRGGEVAGLALAVGSFVLGLVPWAPLLPVPAESASMVVGR